MQKKLISIIVPIYNVENYILDFINSFKGQNTENIEFIFVNDGSTDNSLKILQQNINNFKDYKIIDKKNEGVSSARNAGLESCLGEYVTFIDPDDKAKEDYLDILRKNIGYDLSMFDYTRFDEKHMKKYSLSIDNGVYEKDFIKSNFLTNLYGIKRLPIDFVIFPMVWGKLYRLDIIQNKNIRFLSEKEYSSEDSLFNIAYLSECNSVNYQKNDIILYRVNNNSLTTKPKDISFYFARDRLLLKYKSFSLFYENEVGINYKNKIIFECIQWFKFIFSTPNSYLNNKRRFNKIYDNSKLKKECDLIIPQLDKLNISKSYRIYFWMINHRLYLICYMIQKIKQKKKGGNL